MGKLAAKQGEKDLYSKYTTASTFRNKNTTQAPAASKEIKPNQKYFDAAAIEIKVPSFKSGGKVKSNKDKLLAAGM